MDLIMAELERANEVRLKRKNIIFHFSFALRVLRKHLDITACRDLQLLRRYPSHDAAEPVSAVRFIAAIPPQPPQLRNPTSE